MTIVWLGQPVGLTPPASYRVVSHLHLCVVAISYCGLLHFHFGLMQICVAGFCFPVTSLSDLTAFQVG